VVRKTYESFTHDISLTALTLVLVTIGAYFGGRNGMTMALIIAAAMNAIALLLLG